MASVRPYGPPILDAIERGDSRRLETAINKAKELHEQQGGDLGKAIRAGEAALKKLKKAAGGTSSGGGKASSTSGTSKAASGGSKAAGGAKKSSSRGSSVGKK
ncbi:MAG: hypothetical protein QOH21_40 [Acidobacteriota bacterium]|jgi:hypothetical protein|nr:hypothetical protein [Acidobacteriota bacterium]